MEGGIFQFSGQNELIIVRQWHQLTNLEDVSWKSAKLLTNYYQFSTFCSTYFPYISWNQRIAFNLGSGRQDPVVKIVMSRSSPEYRHRPGRRSAWSSDHASSATPDGCRSRQRPRLWSRLWCRHSWRWRAGGRWWWRFDLSWRCREPLEPPTE